MANFMPGFRRWTSKADDSQIRLSPANALSRSRACVRGQVVTDCWNARRDCMMVGHFTPVSRRSSEDAERVLGIKAPFVAGLRDVQCPDALFEIVLVIQDS